VRVFKVMGLQEAVAALRQDFFAELGAVLDPERFDLFTRSLGGLDAGGRRPAHLKFHVGRLQ